MADGFLIVSKDILYFLIMTGLFLRACLPGAESPYRIRPLSFRITRYVVFISGMLLMGWPIYPGPW